MRASRSVILIVSATIGAMGVAACPSTSPAPGPVPMAAPPAPPPTIVAPVIAMAVPADAGTALAAVVVAPVDAGVVDAGVVDAGADECTRSNAAAGEARVDVAKVTRYEIERDVKGRTITEQFSFDGYAFTTSESGCAHAGHTVIVQGPGFGATKRDRAGLAALLARVPMTGTELFQAALKTPDACDQYTPETEVLRCGDASIEVSWGHNGATLSYDFAL